jgi:hypothetical protein
MHIHSGYSSDSKLEIEDILKAAKRKKLDGIAVTDHNEIEGALKAYRLAGQYGVAVIRGTEITTSDGHVVAYGLTKKVRKELSTPETIDTVEALGGICVAAHPYRRISGIGGRVARNFPFTAIEAVNGRSPASENEKAIKLAYKMQIPQTGGSDAHDIETIGTAYTVFRLSRGEATEDELLEAVRKGECEPGGRGITVRELVRYYYSVGTKWAKRGFRRV